VVRDLCGIGGWCGDDRADGRDEDLDAGDGRGAAREKMTADGAIMKADELVERGAVFFEDLARKAAAKGGAAAKLAEPLADDAVFLRKVKPSLVAARLRGEQPGDGEVTVMTRPVVMAAEPPPSSSTGTGAAAGGRSSSGGPNPIVVAGAAFVAGVFLAKFVDWRGHAHPRH
jgi:hypothetical protein